MATRVSRVSEFGYYYWRHRPPSARDVRHAWLTETMTAIHTAAHGTYGARRIHARAAARIRHIHVRYGAVELLMRSVSSQSYNLAAKERPCAAVLACAR
jgi:putative transposase